MGKNRHSNWIKSNLMPAEYSMETLPEPADTRVKLVLDPGHLKAAVRYAGTWSDDGYKVL